MERKKARLPDMELSAEATARLAELSQQPHHPSAVPSNIAKAKETLRRRVAHGRASQAQTA